MNAYTFQAQTDTQSQAWPTPCAMQTCQPGSMSQRQTTTAFPSCVSKQKTIQFSAFFILASHSVPPQHPYAQKQTQPTAQKGGAII
ncbi:MAG: hypothetical protein KBE23_11030 [Chloroflexi bacterium]|nr:hypothetical protein [Chloroflexota bacterium]